MKKSELIEILRDKLGAQEEMPREAPPEPMFHDLTKTPSTCPYCAKLRRQANEMSGCRALKPNHYIEDSLGDPYECIEDHNHPDDWEEVREMRDALRQEELTEATFLGNDPWPTNTKPETPESVLEEAIRIVGGARAGDYGENSQNRIAQYWNLYLSSRGLIDLDDGDGMNGRDVSAMMILLKIARDTHKPKRDNAVDVAGYAELMERE